MNLVTEETARHILSSFRIGESLIHQYLPDIVVLWRCLSTSHNLVNLITSTTISGTLKVITPIIYKHVTNSKAYKRIQASCSNYGDILFTSAHSNCFRPSSFNLCPFNLKVYQNVWQLILATVLTSHQNPEDNIFTTKLVHIDYLQYSYNSSSQGRVVMCT